MRRKEKGAYKEKKVVRRTFRKEERKNVLRQRKETGCIIGDEGELTLMTKKTAVTEEEEN